MGRLSAKRGSSAYFKKTKVMKRGGVARSGTRTDIISTKRQLGCGKGDGCSVLRSKLPRYDAGTFKLRKKAIEQYGYVAVKRHALETCRPEAVTACERCFPNQARAGSRGH